MSRKPGNRMFNQGGTTTFLRSGYWGGPRTHPLHKTWPSSWAMWWGCYFVCPPPKLQTLLAWIPFVPWKVVDSPVLMHFFQKRKNSLRVRKIAEIFEIPWPPLLWDLQMWSLCQAYYFWSDRTNAGGTLHVSSEVLADNKNTHTFQMPIWRVTGNSGLYHSSTYVRYMQTFEDDKKSTNILEK